ncbi:MerR family transcriptional regulator [Mycobacterium sp. TNTM28]|uniref:MerR family transcriptional regulator n=1 Tax=[Mycobacterium] fortunisiensis TaxID=2600579 RepID=A0ABS6KQW9_9MYCO|nr:MerR family transcriptional regulator [[Mycobacterium] fortunisiensis]MBU9765909.1 MerR family transcriptional regulator [[Mycobacterium] fortunisiensis]
MVEYRLEDLARISGVSARNIRAYRERGLLDSPRRVGRSAYYGERHVAQLAAISQLLAKGFNSAHISEFFAGLRGGRGLADTLGIDPSSWRVSESGLDVDPTDDDARTLVAAGVAHVTDGRVELSDPVLAEMVGGTEDRALCVRIMARLTATLRPASAHTG